MPFTVGEFYHVYNRGVDKRKIFLTRGDWDRFRDSLYVHNTERAVKFRDLPEEILSFDRDDITVDIVAYTLMPNHFHLLLREKKEGGISAFMGKLLTSYSMYFNTKYQRSGPLMCRPFRSRHIDSDEYLRWVFAYIHLNPLESLEPAWKENGLQNSQRASEHLRSYVHSSYQDYFHGYRKASRILSREDLPIDISEFVSGDELFSSLQEGIGEGAFAVAEKFLNGA